MKVHYETISKALKRVIREADEKRRRIEYIELTPAEWAELEREFVSLLPHPTSTSDLTTYLGISIRKSVV